MCCSCARHRLETHEWYLQLVRDHPAVREICVKWDEDLLRYKKELREEQHRYSREISDLTPLIPDLAAIVVQYL